MDLPKIAGIGSEYLLLGFFLFIAFYIIVRLLAERHEHARKRQDDLEHFEGGTEDMENNDKEV
jgi:hypothetical protein